MSHSPRVFFCFQMSSTYTESEIAGGLGDAQAYSHLVCEGQKVVVDQNRCRCMVIMLGTRVKRGSLWSTTQGRSTLKASLQTVISDAS